MKMVHTYPMQHARSRGKTSEKKILLENSSYFSDCDTFPEKDVAWNCRIWCNKKRQPHSHCFFSVYIRFLFYFNFSFSSDFCTCLVWCILSTAGILMTSLAQDLADTSVKVNTLPLVINPQDHTLNITRSTYLLPVILTCCFPCQYHNTVNPC
jgi:hypothetical protein